MEANNIPRTGVICNIPRKRSAYRGLRLIALLLILASSIRMKPLGYFIH